MQASPLPYHHFYHNPYHQPIQGPQDHELKKQYLSLLPPQQIIDICLNFDLHVPHYVKSTIWPPDINAAIATLRSKASTSTPAASESVNNEPSKPDAASSSTNGSVPTASPEKPSEGTSQQSETNVTTGSQEPTEKQPDPQPPDKPSASSSDSPAAAQAEPPVSTAAVSTPSHTEPPTSTPQPSTSQVQPTQQQEVPQPAQTQHPAQPQPAPPPQQPPYPHQAYGYPQPAYPHAPYYQHGGYPYPYPQWPGYPPHPHMPGAPAYPQHQHQPPPANPASPYPNPQPPPPPPADPFTMNAMTTMNPPGGPADDLPSYEEMIVEALTGCTDPEGCAPKDLFTWMAGRYPLQSNFRPSASQALQKAFKRGRLEKSSGGKYRLNANWEGGTTSRRTTRRPQTQGQASAAQPPTSIASSSPFTHAPLVHHHQNQQHQQHQNNPQQYPFGYPYPGYPGHVQPGQPQQHSQAGIKTLPSGIVNGTAPAGPSNGGAPSDDPYEAAQNILKAINFGGLFKLPPEDDGRTTAAASPEMHPNDVASPPMNGAISPLVRFNGANMDLPAAAESTGGEMNPRAELQAQLVLLAAQLAELAQEDGEDPTQVKASVPPPTVFGASMPVAGPSTASAAGQQPPAPTPVVPQILPDPPSAPTPVHPHPPPIAALEPPMMALQQPRQEEDSEEEDDDDMEEVI